MNPQMRLKMRISLFLILSAMSLLSVLPGVLAGSGTIPLLAVRMEDGITSGSKADLTLEIAPGSGRVFVDTFPLSRVDTQMSMRLAKEIACDTLNKDCRDLDFIYTLRADSPIVGGPSAGAAAAVLTVATLSSYHLPQDIAMTGTINSGGLVGPVGGLKEKIEAAKAAGIQMVLVPRGEYVVNASNATLEDYAEDLGVELRTVDSIQDALQIMLPGRFRQEKEEIRIDSSYRETMKGLAESLCNRTASLRRSFGSLNVSSALNFSAKAEEHFRKGQYYAAASNCFGANVRFNEAFLKSKEFSPQKYGGLFSELRAEIESFEKETEKKRILTITDLESSMVIKERLLEAKESLDALNASTGAGNESPTENFAYAYAYANERLRSAYAWAEFLNHQGQPAELDRENLKATCEQKIGEAEERIEYLAVTTPLPVGAAKETLQVAYLDLAEGSHALCIFRASKAKAESNIILSALGLTMEELPGVVDSKLEAAGRVISRAGRKGMFPILGYSYYEYAQTLATDDPASALLYAEYSLEFSNLDMYFKQRPQPKLAFSGEEALILGVLLGFILGFVVNRLRKR